MLVPHFGMLAKAGRLKIWKEMIVKMGYHRRDKEVQELEKALSF